MPKTPRNATNEFTSLSQYVEVKGPIRISFVPMILRNTWAKMRRLPQEQKSLISAESIEINRMADVRICLPPAQTDKKSWKSTPLAKPDRPIGDACRLARLASWMICGLPHAPINQFDTEEDRARLLTITSEAVTQTLLQAQSQNHPAQSANEFLDSLQSATQTLGGWKLAKHPSGSDSSLFQVDLPSHETNGSELVLKLARQHSTNSERSLARFYLAAKLGMSEELQGIAKVIEVNRDGPHHYAVMEKLHGRNLLETVKANGPYPVDAALQRIQKLCRHLWRAHQLGIVHRNIQPNNIFVGHEGKFHLTGWGASKISSCGIELLEPTQNVGNANFSAPEQMIDATQADASSDVFALAGVLFFMLTGMPPFDASSKRICYMQKTKSLHWRDELLTRNCPEYVLGLFDRVFRRRKSRKIKSLPHFASVCRRIARLFSEGLEHQQSAVIPKPEKTKAIKTQVSTVASSILKGSNAIVESLYRHPEAG